MGLGFRVRGLGLPVQDLWGCMNFFLQACKFPTSTICNCPARTHHLQLNLEALSNKEHLVTPTPKHKPMQRLAYECELVIFEGTLHSQLCQAWGNSFGIPPASFAYYIVMQRPQCWERPRKVPAAKLLARVREWQQGVTAWVIPCRYHTPTPILSKRFRAGKGQGVRPRAQGSACLQQVILCSRSVEKLAVSSTDTRANPIEHASPSGVKTNLHQDHYMKDKGTFHRPKHLGSNIHMVS